MKPFITEDFPVYSVPGLRHTTMFPVLLAFLLLFSCENFTEVDPPNYQLTGVTVFSDRATADAALANVYIKLRDTGLLTGSATGLSARMGLYADEFAFYGSGSNTEIAFFNNAVIPSERKVEDMWNASYHQIYAANAIIEGVAQSASLTAPDKAQLTGEALFIRALVHLYLVNLFGDIPYITTTDYEVNRLAQRKAEAEVYQDIIDDLQMAAGILPEEYVSAERVRANKGVVNALLARTYLYAGAWPEASNTASAVLNSDLYAMETDLSKVFLKGSTETIWQFIPRAAGINTLEGAAFIFLTGPPPNLALTPDFIDAFEANDQRKVHWVKAVSSGTSTWYHPFKYKQRAATASTVEYSIVFRLAEQYLIRAEARARQGEVIGAIDDLNVIRNIADIGPTTATTVEGLLDDIELQRRLELFSEFGHRFFDLKRTGRLDGVLDDIKPGWNSTDRLLPLPQKELLSNPNLGQQNPGY